MEKQKLRKIFNIISIVFSWVYLLIFAAFLFNYFMNTGMYKMENYFSQSLMYFLMNSLVVVIVVRYVFEFLNKRIKIWQIIYAVIASVIGYKCWHTIGPIYGDYMLILTMLIVGAININYRDLLKTYLIVKVPALIYTIIASQIGVITDLVYLRPDGVTYRHSFGIVYPTDFAAHVFYIIVAWCLIRQIRITYWEIGGIFGIAVVLLKLCDARTSFICLTVLFCALIALKLFYKFAKHVDENQDFPRNLIKPDFRLLFCILPVIAIGAFFVLAHSGYWSPIMDKLNSILSNRLILSKRAFELYNVTKWGQHVIIIGNGGSTVAPDNYFFIDNSYLFVLMLYGVFMFLLQLSCSEVVIAKNLRKYYTVAMIYVIMLHCMLEHHYFEFFYNFVLLMPLADWENGRELLRITCLPTKRSKYKLNQ